jgi:hypothetical protein
MNDKEMFEKWRLDYISTHTGYFKMIGTDDLAQVVWQAACAYKDIRIKQADKIIKDRQDELNYLVNKIEELEKEQVRHIEILKQELSEDLEKE